MTTYVIGDIHGMYKLLFDLANQIKDDAKNTSGLHKIIFLGDYVDRGPDSVGVVDFVKGPFFKKLGFDVVALMGNHEEMMLAYCNVKGFYNGEVWLPNGGTATVNSYGGSVHDIYYDHLEWMRKLPLFHVDKKFFFVHAGVNPMKGIHEQRRNDLLWIRQPWLSYRGDFWGLKVVHGHTPTTFLNRSTDPDVQNNSVAIDTGSSHSGVLTAMKIPDTNNPDDFSFIQAKDKIIYNQYYARYIAR